MAVVVAPPHPPPMKITLWPIPCERYPTMVLVLDVFEPHVPAPETNLLGPPTEIHLLNQMTWVASAGREMTTVDDKTTWLLIFPSFTG